MKQHANKNEWHYIPSKFNIVDGCTQPIKFKEFDNNCHCLNGPKFLRCLELPNFSCSEDRFPVNLKNINFESNYLKEHEVSQKKDSSCFFGNNFQIGINSLEL